MKPEQKIIQYLEEAHASEVALVNVLTEQIAVTPRGSYRSALERHHAETRDHAARLRTRLDDLGVSRNPVAAAAALGLAAMGQAVALAKTPLDLLRGTSGPEKILKNAKDSAAAEQLEIATYHALEHLARAVGDRETAELAAAIRADEERMLASIGEELPGLVEAVVRADIEGEHVFDLSATGAGEAARGAARTAARATRRAARSVPGEERVEGTVRGAVAGEEDLPIAGYDDLNADEVTGRLGGLSQVDLAMVEAYERRHAGRSTVLDRIASLRGNEPWSGYDEQNVGEVRSALGKADRERARQVVEYERAHKNRSSVLAAAEQRR